MDGALGCSALPPLRPPVRPAVIRVLPEDATLNIQNETFLDSGRWEGRAFFADWAKTSAGVINVRNPATDAVIASVGIGGADDIARAANEARAAQPAWAKTLPSERARILNETADLLEANGSELTPWIMRESGSIRPKAGIEIQHGALFIHHAATLATQPMGLMLPTMDGRTNYARRLPHGVVGVISPFNFPLVLSVRAIAAAHAFGNAAVHKPDPRTSISGGVIIAGIFEEAGLPKGVLQIVPGGADAGEAMCRDPNIAMISFTGSAKGGSKVGELAGRHLKKVQLELGGKNALVVLEDADPDIAASNAAWGAFLHQGQICMATGLILAHDSIVGALTERLVAKASHLPASDPSTGRVALGPIISDGQVASIQKIGVIWATSALSACAELSLWPRLFWLLQPVAFPVVINRLWFNFAGTILVDVIGLLLALTRLLS